VIIVPGCQEISRQIRFDKFVINLPSIYGKIIWREI